MRLFERSRWVRCFNWSSLLSTLLRDIAGERECVCVVDK